MTDTRHHPASSADATRSRSPRFRLAFVPAWLVVSVTTAVFVLFDPTVPLTFQLVPLAASVVLIGLPHGAVDHLAIPRSRDEPVTARWLAAIGVLYLLAGSVYAAAWFLDPAVALVFFILLTWVHWGQGELYPLVELTDATHLDGRGVRVLTATTRGALPMLVPLVFFPGQYALVASTLVGLFDPDAAVSLAVAFTPDARLAVGVGLAALIVVTLGLGARATAPDGQQPWLLDASETLGLVVFFATVPPLLAVGLYFCFWHSLRHVVRLILVDDDAASALDDRRYGAALGRFARDAAPLTALSLALLLALFVALPSPTVAPLELVGAYLVVIAVLTLPHTLVVAWMDHEQAVWGVRTDTP